MGESAQIDQVVILSFTFMSGILFLSFVVLNLLNILKATHFIDIHQ